MYPPLTDDDLRVDPSVCSQNLLLGWNGHLQCLFHPLARFPGPELCTAYRLPFIISMVKGDLAHQNKDIHAKYGEIFRKHLTSYHLPMSLLIALATRSSPSRCYGLSCPASSDEDVPGSLIRSQMPVTPIILVFASYAYTPFWKRH